MRVARGRPRAEGTRERSGAARCLHEAGRTNEGGDVFIISVVVRIKRDARSRGRSKPLTTRHGQRGILDLRNITAEVRSEHTIANIALR